MLELFKLSVDPFFETHAWIPMDHSQADEPSSKIDDIKLHYRLLENDMWQKVFCYTKISDFKHLSAVCKNWRFNANKLFKEMSGNVLSILNEKNQQKISSSDLNGVGKLIKKHGPFIVANFKVISKKFNVSLQKEFDCLLENEVKNFSTIIKISKSHDILMTWIAFNECCKNISIGWNIEKINSIEELIDTANAFKKWIGDNNVYSQKCHIKLHNKNMISLPAELELLNVEVFEFINNKLIFFSWEILRKWPELWSLNLRNIGLEHFPKELCLNHKLEVLNLRDNCLREIPDHLYQFKKLNDMDLRNNPLISLPKRFCNQDMKITLCQNDTDRLFTLVQTQGPVTFKLGLDRDKKHLLKNCENSLVDGYGESIEFKNASGGKSSSNCILQ